MSQSFGPPGPGQPVPPAVGAPVPPRKRGWIKWAVLLPLLTIGACSVGSAIGGADSTGVPAASSTVTVTAPADGKPVPTVTVTAPADGKPAPTVTVTAKAEPAPTVTVTEKAPADEPADEPAETDESDGVTDGTWLVGEDIDAGRYVTAGPDGLACYWERSKNDSGEFDAIIANGTEAGRGSVSLKKGEYFKTTGCKPWVKR